jgi:hypothetical protein
MNVAAYGIWTKMELLVTWPIMKYPKKVAQ